mmetsp:Transcript_87911/g.151837  ORF Transcript_87911/g.151837 Transcript_87911/m.151837 type:complete len:316 (+) Transcript_87911:34-981(+)
MSDAVGLWILVAINLVSIAGCSCLLCRFCSLPQHILQRLFPRQLWHLSVADLAFCIGSIINAIIEFGGVLKWLPDRTGEPICHYQLIIPVCSGLASGSFELHIAVSFALVHFRCLQTLRVVNRLLIFIWPVCIILGVIDVFEFDSFSKIMKICVTARGDYLLSSVIVFEFVVSCFAYITVLVGSLTCLSRSPLSVHTKMWRRTLWYPMNFFVTYGLMFVYLLFPDKMLNLSGYLQAAWVMVSLNGCLNYLTYAYNTRYAQRESALRHGNGEERSDHISPTSTPEQDLFGIASFHVAFASEHSSRSVVGNSLVSAS